jgi:hypothetical protein
MTTVEVTMHYQGAENLEGSVGDIWALVPVVLSRLQMVS